MKLSILLLAAAASSGNLISISPHVCREPCQIHVDIRSEAPTDKWVCVGLDNGVFYSSSCWPGHGRTIHQTTIKNIPAGEYEVVGVVEGKTMRTNLLVDGE